MMMNHLSTNKCIIFVSRVCLWTFILMFVMTVIAHKQRKVHTNVPLNIQGATRIDFSVLHVYVTIYVC